MTTTTVGGGPPSGDATAEDVDKVQDDTLAAVDRIRRQLEDSNAVAAQTSETLARQGEQMDDVNRDLNRLHANLQTADKQLDKLERWRASVGSSFQVAWQEERAAHQRDLNEMTRELGAAQDRAGDRCQPFRRRHRASDARDIDAPHLHKHG